jgi:hypothetical protein
MAMTTRHFCHAGVDTEATRRQFLFAREQLAAHSPGGRARLPQYARRLSGRLGDEIPNRSEQRLEN